MPEDAELGHSWLIVCIFRYFLEEIEFFVWKQPLCFCMSLLALLIANTCLLTVGAFFVSSLVGVNSVSLATNLLALFPQQICTNALKKPCCYMSILFVICMYSLVALA